MHRANSAIWVMAPARMSSMISFLAFQAEGGTDNITGEIHTVVRYSKAGLYTFGFNSDDGFKTIGR